MQGTSLGDRLDLVQVDVGNAHVVSYVSWLESDPERLQDEAVVLAAKVKKAAPISADIRMWAEDPKDKSHKVFDGLILGEAAGRFQESRIIDFARTRYIKAFQFARTDPPQPGTTPIQLQLRFNEPAVNEPAAADPATHEPASNQFAAAEPAPNESAAEPASGGCTPLGGPPSMSAVPVAHD